MGRLKAMLNSDPQAGFLTCACDIALAAAAKKQPLRAKLPSLTPKYYQNAPNLGSFQTG
jgi:hypothetical protein